MGMGSQRLLLRMLLLCGDLGECIAMLGKLHIWKSYSLESYKVFLWLSIKKKCWTADKLGWHGLQHLAACLVCEQDDETLDHLLMGCLHSCEI
jgi:hypothetical protein